MADPPAASDDEEEEEEEEELPQWGMVSFTVRGCRYGSVMPVSVTWTDGHL